MNKKYAVKHRRTGKMSRTFATREAARTFKRNNAFRYSIVNLATQQVVR